MILQPAAGVINCTEVLNVINRLIFIYKYLYFLRGSGLSYFDAKKDNLLRTIELYVLVDPQMVSNLVQG
tara:strand:- start:408 stop:614 length:207 start_codon:yes stop_codon:yes gene_type:complete